MHPLRLVSHGLPHVSHAQDRARLAAPGALPHERPRRGTDLALGPARRASRPLSRLPRLRNRVPRGRAVLAPARGDARADRAPLAAHVAAADARTLGAAERAAPPRACRSGGRRAADRPVGARCSPARLAARPAIAAAFRAAGPRDDAPSPPPGRTP